MIRASLWSWLRGRARPAVTHLAPVQIQVAPGAWLEVRHLPQAPAQIRVRVTAEGRAPLDMALPVFRSADAGLCGLLRLPAGLWCGGVGGIRLQVYDGRGQAIGPEAGYSRQDLLAGLPVGVLAGEGGAELAGMRALELIHALTDHPQGRAASWDLLPAEVCEVLTTLAGQRQLLALLPDGGDLPPRSDPPAPVQLRIQALRSAWIAAREAAGPGPDLAVLLTQVLAREDGGPPPPGFLLTLAEVFHAENQIPALAGLVRQSGWELPDPAPYNDWLNATLLPFLALAGDYARLSVALEHLGRQSQGWLVSSLLAWVLHHVLDPPADVPLSKAQTTAFIRQWMAAVEGQAAQPWGRSPCRELIGAGLALLDRAPPDMAPEVAAFALRCYGMSPTFLRQVSSLTAGSETLFAAGSAFDAIRAEVQRTGRDPAIATQAQAGYAMLARSGVWGLEALRAECPGLLRPPEQGEMADDGERLLRWYARPGAEPVSLTRVAALRVADLAAMPGPNLPAASVPDAGGPVFVMVRSCRAHLAGRLPRLRAGWLGQAERLGCRIVVTVGRGAEDISGHDLPGEMLLELPVGDSREDLAEKTLAMLAWAQDAGAAHVWVVEDDTLPDVEALFGPAIPGSACWRQAPWYGQGVPPRSTLAWDMLPASAWWPDAGLGYALDRSALAALCAALQSFDGQRLRQAGGEADRLVGALLTLAGIALQTPERTAALLRAPRAGGVPVMVRGAEGFFPSPASAGLAGHSGAGVTLPPDPPGLFPRRLWPATVPASTGPDGHALVLVAGGDHLERACTDPVAVVAVLRNEMFMLPHFLSHYRRMGVGSFLIADNGSDDGSTGYLAAQPDVVVFSAATPFREAMQGTEWKVAMMAQLRPNRWTLVADTDELLVGRDLRGPGHVAGWHGGADLANYLHQPKFDGCDAFRLYMLDMYPAGPLSEADFAGTEPFLQANLADKTPFRRNWPGRGPYSDRISVTSGLRHRLLPGSPSDMYVSEKVSLLRYRPWMRLSVSLHYAAEVQLAPDPLIFAHFKYNAEFRARALREIRRGQYFNNAAEYRRYAEALREGREALADPEVSVPWREAAAPWL